MDFSVLQTLAEIQFQLNWGDYEKINLDNLNSQIPESTDKDNKLELEMKQNLRSSYEWHSNKAVKQTSTSLKINRHRKNSARTKCCQIMLEGHRRQIWYKHLTVLNLVKPFELPLFKLICFQARKQIYESRWDNLI